MALFKDMLGSGETLFKNENALDYSFVPKLIPYRDSEQFHIATCIKPLFQQRNGRNLFIFGQPSTGKTVALKHVMNELEEQTDDIYPIYINCWQHNSTYKILLEICDAIGYKFTQNKRSDELFIVAKQILNKNSAVLIFDEIDKLQDYDFLYSILEEIYRKTIIAITNEKNWLATLDTRIRSRLSPEPMEFKQYNFEEIKGILKQRMDYAFYPGAWEQEAFEMIAKKTDQMKDLRRGLFLLRQAAQNAEEKAARQVTKEHALKAIEQLDDFTVKDIDEIDEDDKLILETVKNNSGKKIGEIYKTYQEAGGKTMYRTFQRKIEKFENDKFLVQKKITGGPEGKTTILTYGTEKKLTEF